MFKKLELKSPKQNKMNKKYFYRIINDSATVIKMTSPNHQVAFLISTNMLDEIKNNVYQIYVLHNSVKKPYIMVSVKSIGKIMISRFIMLKQGEKIKDKIVDHLNGRTLDNRTENLRVTDKSNNMRNRKQKANLTGYRGVHPSRNTPGKYESSISLGTFDTPEKAYEAYQEAYKKLFPEAVHPSRWVSKDIL